MTKQLLLLGASAISLTNEAAIKVNRFGFSRVFEENGRRLRLGLRARF